MQHIITLSLLIAAVLLIRALFRKHISPNVTYALWLLVVLKMCIPFSFFNVGLPAASMPQNEAVQQNTAINDVIFDPIIKTQTQEAHGTPTYETGAQGTITFPEQSEDQAPTASSISQGKGNEQSDVIPPAASVQQNTEQRLELPEISHKMLLTLLWFIGSEVLAIWFISSGLIFTFGIRRSRRAIGRYRGIRVYTSEKAGTPCLHGIIPAIYLTPEANESSDRELILRHEYTHLRHGDNLWALLRTAALILLWWNPLVWAAALLSKQDSELACDHAVTKDLDETRRKDYAYMLIDMIPKKRTVATGFANNSIKERIIMMTEKHKSRIFAAILAFILAFAAAGCSFIGFKETADGKEILPNAEAEIKRLDLYRYDGKEMTVSKLNEANEVKAFISSLETDGLEVIDDFKHSAVKGDIYGFRIIGEASEAYAFVNGYLITDSGEAYKYDKDIFSLANKYFGEEAEKEKLTKYFPCLRYIAIDGNSWDISYMPRATINPNNYQIDDKPFEPTVERFYGEKIELYNKNADGSIKKYLNINQLYDLYVMLDSRWYDVPINEDDYKEREQKVYTNVSGESSTTEVKNTIIGTFVNDVVNFYGVYSVDIPHETPGGYYKLNILGSEVEFPVDQEERQRIAAAGDVDTEELDSVISSLIPSIVPNTEIGSGYNVFSYRMIGMEKDGDMLTVYILGHYSEFSFDSKLNNEKSITFPAILKFNDTKSGYVLTDKVSAYPWSDLEYDMPVNVWRSISYFESDAIIWEAYKNAVEHFDFDPSQTIEENIDAYLLAEEALANDELSSADRKNFYNQKYSSNLELINYGEYTMKYICNQIMSGREMIGAYGDYIRKLILNLTHDAPIDGETTKEYFYSVYTTAWSMRNTDEARIKQYYPMMFAITECIKQNSLRNPSAIVNVSKTYLITSDSDHLFSYTDKNKGIELEFYSSKEDPKKYKVGYYDSEGDLMPSMGHNIVGAYTYDSALPIYVGSEGLELFYILKMTSGEEVYYLKFVSSLAGKLNGVNYPTFGFSGEISEEEVNRLLEEQKG